MKSKRTTPLHSFLLFFIAIQNGVWYNIIMFTNSRSFSQRVFIVGINRISSGIEWLFPFNSFFLHRYIAIEICTYYTVIEIEFSRAYRGTINCGGKE